MFEQNLPNSPRRLVSHNLVFVHNVKLSPLLLNDDSNSFEVYSINSRNEFVDCFQSQRPGCLVTNMSDDILDFPNMNLMSRLLPIVVVTNSSSVSKAVDASKRGAHTVLRNLNDTEKVREAVRKACFADSVAETGAYYLRCRINNLTSKEKQVVYMSLRGKTTKMVSSELGVCHQTVDKHKKRALRKMNASSMIDLMNILLQSHRIASGIEPLPNPRTAAQQQLPVKTDQPDTAGLRSH